MTVVCPAPPATGNDWRGFRDLLAALARLPSEAGDVPDVHVVPSSTIESLRQRDPNAWHHLFSTEMPAVYRYALSRVGNPSDAEDLAGRVFEEAWEHAESLHDRGLPPRAWLFGIARHLVNTHRRRWFRHQPALALEAFGGHAEDPGLDSEMLDLARALASLAAGHSEVINLRFIHGLSLQETAEVLGTTVDGVKGRQARALAELRLRLGGPPPAAAT